MSRSDLGVAVGRLARLMAVVMTTGGLVGTDASAAEAVTPAIAPEGTPAYAADLVTAAAMNAFGAQWRNMDVRIVEVPAIPTAPAQWKTTNDLLPKAGQANFDDSAWPVIEPTGLRDQRGGGHIFMTWYRTRITIPAKIEDFDPTGTKAVFAIRIDDYAEVWVNGAMPRSTTKVSPQTIQGYNTANRVVLSDSVKPGDKFEIAVLGINGPISVSPANGVFVREARIEFFK